MAFRRISGELIRKKRGERTQQQIADASGGRFTRANLSQWELDIHVPHKDADVLALIQALGCRWEQISVVVEPQKST